MACTTILILLLLTEITLPLSLGSTSEDCLEQRDQSKCNCYRVEKIIDCRSNPEQYWKFPKIPNVMLGYVAMTFMGTNLSMLSVPSEAYILSKLPNLTIIDFSGIPGVDCKFLQNNFHNITITADCPGHSHNRDHTSRINEQDRTINHHDEKCNFWCHVKKVYGKVKTHFNELVQKLKQEVLSRLQQVKVNAIV